MNAKHTLLFALILLSLVSCDDSIGKWETVSATGQPTARHEAAFVAFKDKLYLIGGRRINPTDVFDPATNTWAAKSPAPIELHHFQPVVVKDAIYLMGAMTGGWPNETPLERVLIYYPERDEYQYGDTIPEHRRRGGAGVVYHQERIYLVGGIRNGHMDGFVPWLDEYDPKTGQWRVLPDAPNSRDHFQAVVVNNQLYAFGGRVSSRKTGEDMSRTIQHGNVFDFNTEKWLPVVNQQAIPTMRAGTASFGWQDAVVIGGGESMTQESAHDQVEAYNTKTGQWVNWPPLEQGRHGSGFAVIGDYVYIASGSGNRGGGPELTSIERLKLPKRNLEPPDASVDNTPVYSQWHLVEMSFEGPETSELADENPFLNYQLSVTFKNADIQRTIRGFYAADGNASETSAEAGNIWQVRFSPDRPGKWTYKATLYHGDSVALAPDAEAVSADEVALKVGSTGSFTVTPSDKDGPDFRAYGKLEAHNGYFRFAGSDRYWLKGGADSPENLLAYEGFDGTYRLQASSRQGEASTSTEIHRYAAHLKHWSPGDPVWQQGKGKSIIGAVNYLASKGMNVAYFLLNNINGDGKDVWPYSDPTDFTRFDVSKLEQWELLFRHMQSKGIMLHMVLQETENETLLDGGDTGPLRKLYLNEMIARFAHHPGLKWNLGEENGPAPFTPVAQDDRQRRDMTSYIKASDPYQHPVLLHTHSHDPPRKEILDQILGFKDLDGLSLQQGERKHAAQVVRHWRQKSIDSGHKWLISMDEIGKWDTGAQSDRADPGHESLRRYVLWGTLLSGAAGVEWYFGANNEHNDLTTEDWSSRDQLWELTKYALDFFEQHLPYWEMEPGQDLVDDKNAYCLAKQGEVYALYLSRPGPVSLNLQSVSGNFSVSWYDPLNGGNLLEGSVTTLSGGGMRALGFPADQRTQDWVVLVKRLD
jgi:hypothetical protein